MKKQLKIFLVFLVSLLAFTSITPVNAQRGYRGYRGNQVRVNWGRYGHPPMVMPYRYNYSPRYARYPSGSIAIMFGGNPYYYSNGSFYRPYGGYYRTVMPPIGIRISLLPVGYIPIFVGGYPYYFHNGSYYRRYNDNNFEVVDAPMGAELSSLPRNARSVVVNGEKFYELNGTYYKEDRNSKGQVVYTVVGKNGKIDNTEEPADAPAPRVGDKILQLPENCKTVNLNGQKLYVSPDDTYYQLENDGSYTVVGIAD